MSYISLINSVPVFPLVKSAGEGRLLHHILVIHILLLSGINWQINCVIEVHLIVFEFLRDFIGFVRNKDNFVSILTDSRKTGQIIDILGLWIGELRQANMMIVVILSTNHDKTLFHKILPQFILWKHAHHSFD